MTSTGHLDCKVRTDLDESGASDASDNRCVPAAATVPQRARRGAVGDPQGVWGAWGERDTWGAAGAAAGRAGGRAGGRRSGLGRRPRAG
jgi:hypothetical protein